jgi:2-methylcitrate dehydratase PrpD
MTSVLGGIAEWCSAATSFGPLVRERARDALVDTVGCILAGQGDPAPVGVARAFAPLPSGPCSIVGGGRTTPSVSALINGTAAHALDFDDNFHGATTHASAVLVPALLAIGEARGCSGARLLDAYVVGLEAQARIGVGVNPSHYTAGWHSTSTVGCIGTAAGVAWLMGLGAEGIARAMTVAVSMAAGVKGQFGTPLKPVHAGLAARNAVEAALLAAAGLGGRPDILEVEQGFLSLYGGAYPRGWHDTPADAPLAIEAFGLAAKRHPCCGATHRVVDMVLDLKREHGFAAHEVTSVEALVTRAHARNLAYDAPADEMQARFSMPYAVALALTQKRLTLADFTPAAVARPAIRALLPLTRVVTYDETLERAATGRLPHHVTLRLSDGRVLQAERLAARGTIADPFSEGDRLAKFVDCCAATALAPAASSLFTRLSAIDAEENLSLIGDVLRFDPEPAGLNAM